MYCKVEGGYAGLQNTASRTSQGNHRDLMESFFIAETLKYLYLLFSNDDILPLESYVFTTEAHPLSVGGKYVK